MNDLKTTTQEQDSEIAHVDTRPKKISVEAIAALLKSGMQPPQIAKVLKCSKQNIYQRIEDAEDLQEFQTYKDFKFENLQRKIYDSIDHAKIQKDSTLQSVTCIGILEDKLRNIRGQATLRIDSFSVTASLDDLARRKQELMDKVMASVQPVVLDTVSTPSIIPDKQDK